MTFARPGWLGLLALAVPIAVLFLVRKRTRSEEVSSLLLWRAVLSAEARRPWAGRLREPLALLLNLLLLGSVVVAAAGPERVQAADEGRVWAVVLDGDVSLRATTGDGESRFEIARRSVEEILARVGRDDRVVVVLAAETPVVLANRALEAAGPARGPTDLAAAIALARRSSRREPDRLVVVGSRDPGDPAVALVAVGETTGNVGFTEVRSIRDATDGRTRVTCRTANAGPEPATREVILRGPGGAEVRTTVTLGPGESVESVLMLDPATDGTAELRLEPGDAYERDDRVVVPVTPAPRFRILATEDLDGFLAAAFTAQGGTIDRERSARIDPDDLPAEVPPGAILVLVDRDLPETFTSGNVWILDAPLGPSRDDPAVTDWAPDHPVLRGLDLGNLGLRRARPGPPPGDARAIVSAEGGAVVTAQADERLRVLRFAFRLSDGNLPVLAAFPLLVRNALAWFAGEENRLFPTAVRAGDRLEALRPLPPDVETVYLSGPALPGPVSVPVRGGRITWDLRGLGAGHGLLVARAGGRVEVIAVNPILPEATSLVVAEGDLAPADLVDRSGRETPDRDLTGLVVLVAAGLLLVEWAWFQRGHRGRIG